MMNLTDDEVESIKYFIEQYNENMNKGNINGAHHDAVAILLFMDNIINHQKRDKP